MINNIGIAINVGVNVRKIIDKGRCKYRFIWNPSICECDKSCDIRVDLDYENCKCRKRLIDKLVEQWSKDINWNKINKMSWKRMQVLYNIHKLLIITFIIIIVIGSACIYLYWHTIKSCFNKLPY